jgi:hypothetical protein
LFQAFEHIKPLSGKERNQLFVVLFCFTVESLWILKEYPHYRDKKRDLTELISQYSSDKISFIVVDKGKIPVHLGTPYIPAETMLLSLYHFNFPIFIVSQDLADEWWEN